MTYTSFAGNDGVVRNDMSLNRRDVDERVVVGLNDLVNCGPRVPRFTYLCCFGEAGFVEDSGKRADKSELVFGEGGSGAGCLVIEGHGCGQGPFWESMIWRTARRANS